MLTGITTVLDLRKAIKGFFADIRADETKAETSSSIERYDMVCLLAILPEANSVEYPVTLTKRERPDFQLIMGNQQIGIEHTRAVPENVAHKDALRKKGYGPETCYISPVPPGEPRKKRKELILEIEQNEQGDGWDGDSPEIEWANAMLYSIKNKLASIKKDGFERFEEDWLLIRDNWSLPAPDIKKAATFLLGATDLNFALQEFSRIFVVTGRIICDFSAKGLGLYRIAK